MKKKQFMSKLAALTMAAAMGVTALPATVMAAPVTGLAVSDQAGADAAATSGLVQTTLPTELTDETGAASQTLLATLKKVYANYDAAVEANVKGLDANAATPTDVTSQLSLSTDGTIADGANSIKYNVALDSTKNITVTPATGNTTATAGSAVIPVIIKFTDSVPTASVSTATLDNEVALNLNVKWGTDVQDVLADAVKNTKTEAEKTGGALKDFADSSKIVNSTTGALDASMIKKVVSAYNTSLDTTPGTLLVNTNDKGYGVKLDYVSATDYVAPTSTTEGGYNLTLKVTVTGKGTGTPNVPIAVTKSENVTSHITLAKTAKVIVTAVSVPTTHDADTVWKATNGTAFSSATKTATVAEAGKAYPINVSVAYTSASSTVIEAAAGNKKSEVSAAGVTISLKGDSSVAHLVDSATANTGKAIIFDKIGSVEIQYTTPNYNNTATSDATDVTSKTDTLGTVDLKDNAKSFQSVLDNLDKTVDASDVSKADDIEAAVKAKVQTAYDNYYGKAASLDITVKDAHNFVAAVAGTDSDTDGTDGSFYVTVTVRNTTSALTAASTNEQWTIAADKYEYTKKFSDVKETNYFAKAVTWGVENNIVSGTSDTTFSPYANVTRAQFVTFLYRQAGSPDVEVNKTFTDIAGLSEEFQKAISWAAANGITFGKSDTVFAPNATVRREEAVTFLFRYTKGEATTKNASFKDVKDGAYYVDAINWGSENGVVKGLSEDSFGVGADTTRGAAITFIYRALAD